MLNMSHTKCSYLINGKGTVQFVRTDVLDIFSNIEKQLADEKCTLGEFNQQVRYMIIQYCESQERAQHAGHIAEYLTEVNNK